jgi:Zn-dependent metalloprotease
MTTLTPEQLAELDRLRRDNPDLRYEAHRSYRHIASLSNIVSALIAEPLDQSALEFVRAHQGLFGVRDAKDELRHPVVSTDNAGWTHITYEQYHLGIPVWSGRLTVHIDPERRLHSVSNSVRPNFPQELKPAINQNEAIKLAREAFKHAKKDRLVREPRLFIYPDEPPALAWVFALEGTQVSYLGKIEFPGAWLYFVDAITGKVIRRAALAREAAQTSTGLSVRNPGRLTQVMRTLQTWHNPTNKRDELRDTVTGYDPITKKTVEIRTYDYNSGDLCWDNDPAPLGDNNWNRTTGETSTKLADRAQYQPAEVDAHFYGGQIYLFWRRAPFNRNSLDNAGCDIQLKPHFASLSAMWYAPYILLGDGDMSSFSFKGGQLDVLGHESTHAVWSAEVPPDGPIYSGQSGAAQESFCDIFGAFAEHNWLFEELVTVPPYSCLRNLANPSDPNAFNPGHDHYADYVSDQNPDPKVKEADPHENCHILNYACYLMTHGGVHHRANRTPPVTDIPVYPGMDWTSAETIYYRALTEGFTGNPGLGTDADPYFAEVRRQILLAAEWAYGHDSCAYKTARLAFYAIGLQPAGEPYGPDVAVTPWGHVTHEGPDWQSPDFFVRDAANNPVEPERGVHNRLFIRVCNIGDQTAPNVQVRVLYAPYSATYHHADFKEIALSGPFNLNSGQQQDVEFDWDLTNLDEDNGGLWPSAGGLAGIRGYDHFCVRAEIVCEADVNSCNNTAQNNFTKVAMHAGDIYDTAFLVFSPFEEECWGQMQIAQRLPRTWKVDLHGVASLPRVRLKPRDPSVVHLKVTASPEQAYEPPFDGEVKGKFGPRRIVTRLIPLREVGEFHAELHVERYTRAMATFRGRMEGTIDRTHQRFSGTVNGRIANLDEGIITGTLEGHVLGQQWAEHEPIKVEFEGLLRPWRDVSVSVEVPGAPTTGIMLRFSRK